MTFNLTEMENHVKWAGLGLSPDEHKCACCWATKPPDEFLMDIWDSYKILICIDCADDGLEVALRENDY